MWEVLVLAEAVEEAWAEDYWMTRHCDITLVSREAECMQQNQRGRPARRERRDVHASIEQPLRGRREVQMAGTKSTKGNREQRPLGQDHECNAIGIQRKLQHTDSAQYVLSSTS